MTEVEKLRALLAEARAVVAGTISAHGLMHRIDAALAESTNQTLTWVDHPSGVDATAFDEQTGTGITVAGEMNGFRWYVKSLGMPVISSAWFDTMDEAKASAQMMVNAFRKGGGRGE